MSIIVKMMDAYRMFARRHPVYFTGMSIILVVIWAAVIMRFSGESAEISSGRSARILVGIVNAVAPSADVTLDNYETVPALHNCEKVVRKTAHMIEYGILSVLIWSLIFGFADFPRRYAYIIPVIAGLCLGMIDERKQTTITGRYGSWFDVSVDVFGAILGVTLAYRLTKRYRRLKIRERMDQPVPEPDR